MQMQKFNFQEKLDMQKRTPLPETLKGIVKKIYEVMRQGDMAIPAYIISLNPMKKIKCFE